MNPKRKLSEDYSEDAMKKEDQMAMVDDDEEAFDDEDEDDDYFEEDEEITMENMVRRERTNSVIQDFMAAENVELKKSLKAMQKENDELKKILKQDYNVTYHAAKKDYE